MEKENRNCINCGAPIESEIDKCPYCGTSYFDICNLVLDGHTPIALRFKTNVKGKEAILTALVVGTGNCSLTTSYDHCDVYSGGAYMEFSPTIMSTELNLEFRAIPNHNKQLFIMKMCDNVCSSEKMKGE